MKIKRDEGMGNIALTILSIITARPEGEEEGGAQCDIKYLIPNTIDQLYESLKRGGRGGDETMVDKYLIPNIALTTMLIMIARPEREWSGDA